MSIDTGYYAIVNRQSYMSKIHLVIDGKPACGAHIGKQSVFQWCARGYYEPYINCENCKRYHRKHFDPPASSSADAAKARTR